VEQVVQEAGVVAVTNTGVTPILISEQQYEKTKSVEGMKETDFRVGVIKNNDTNMFEAVLIPDNARYCIDGIASRYVC